MKLNDTNAPVASPPPTLGAGTATLLGGTTASFVAGASADPGGTNQAWGTSHYPSATNNNRSAGARFDVSTAGYENIVVSWCQYNSASASRYVRLQYTMDGVNFTDAALIALYKESAFTNQSVNLGGIAGVTNNPRFGFQLVAEFESTATGTGTNAYVATKDGANYSTAGAIRLDLATVSGTPFPPPDGNTPPYIFSSIPDQTVRPGESTGPLSFLVLDAKDPARNLVVSAASSNPAAVPPANILLGGSGANRTVNVTGGGQAGFSLMTLSVFDTGGKSNSASFGVTVLPANSTPVISAIPHTNTLMSVPTQPIAFTVSDRETPAAGLVVSGSSANPALVPNSPANISFGGSGTNRTVTLTPAPGQLGVAPITVTVSDGTNTASAIFTLMVRPSTNVLFYEPFAYGDGSLLTNSGFLWDNRAGTYGQGLVTNGQLQVTAEQTEDVVAPLIGSPYNKSNGIVLYASFKVNFLTLPRAAPDYFAHFANGSSYLRGRIYAGTSNAAPNCFRLFVANGSNAATMLPADLHTNSLHTLVTRYNLDTATATLWLDPAAESDASVTASDPQSAANIAAYGFRQDSGVGATALVDDLRVGLSFAAVTGSAATGPVLTIERAGPNAVLRWTSSSCLLQAAGSVTGTFTNVPGAASPFTNPLAGPARFFRLKGN